MTIPPMPEKPSFRDHFGRYKPTAVSQSILVAYIESLMEWGEQGWAKVQALRTKLDASESNRYLVGYVNELKEQRDGLITGLEASEIKCAELQARSTEWQRRESVRRDERDAARADAEMLAQRVNLLEGLILESCDYITCALPTKCDTAFAGSVLGRAALAQHREGR